MHLSASRPAEGDYYQSEEHRLWFDAAAGKIFLEKTLVRYGPGDDLNKQVDLCLSLDEFPSDEEAKKIVADWFGGQALEEVMAEIEGLQRKDG